MLLTTKLAIPQQHSHLVARPRLFSLLDASRQSKLILVSAPAGFGKTTLITEWIRRVPAESGDAKPRFAWLTLDEHDNDPVRFLTYLVAALQKHDATIGAAVQPLLQAAQQPPLENILTLVINDLSQLITPLWLVLDDYHLMTTPTIHQLLTFCLDNLPPALHLVITTRTDPPLPLARWRVRRDLVEIRARDLRFTEAEATEFLHAELAGALSPANITALTQRTEGWIAGLQLAALSLAERTDLDNFIEAFTGSHAYIVDYLVEEVLQRQPAEVEQFLLQTSILTRLNGALCDAVTGRNDSQTMLGALERANLFLVPLDNERRWYRYHYLFADVLRRRLQQTQLLDVVQLHRQASLWFCAHDAPSEAIQHAFAALDFALVTDLLERAAETFLKRGEYITLQGWLNRLPGEVVRTHARLCLFRASIAVITHELETAQQWLEGAEQAAQTEAAALRETLLAEAAAIGAGVALNRGNFPRVLELARYALDKLPTNQTRLRGEVMLHLGLALSWSGDPAGARRAYGKASQWSQAAGDMHTAVLASYNQGSQQYMQGDLYQAAATYQQALQIAAEHGATPIPITGIVQRGLGELYYEWNDLEKAHFHLQQALERGEHGALPRVLLLNYLALARLLQAQGKTTAALECVQKAQQLREKFALPARYASPTTACQVRLWLMQGQLAPAVAWAQTIAFAEHEVNLLLETEYLVLARVCIAQGELAQALRIATHFRQAAEAVNRINSVIEIMAVQAVALAAQGERTAALATLAQALTLAEPGGYLRMFVDEGEPMRLLLAEYSAQRPPRKLCAYADRILAAFAPGKEKVEVQEIATPFHTPHSTFRTLVEPLTEREVEVLCLLAQGLSDREMAEHLIVVVGTVKRHLNNLYGKLGVHSRTQALARARALGLL
ncbi:MAG: HTH-type transcriptional regulator MalT [Caldilineaceae bacterium]